MPDYSSLSSVEEWLNAQGHRLEFEVARLAEERGLAARLGSFAVSEDGTYREVDASVCLPPESFDVDGVFHNISALSIIECRYSRERPWVILAGMRSDYQDSLDYFRHSVSMEVTMASMMNIKKYAKPLRECFEHPTAPEGFNLVSPPVGKNRDHAYTALAKVLDVCKGGLSSPRFLEVKNKLNQFMPVGIWSAEWPVLVVDGPLYLGMWNEDESRIRLAEVEIGRVRWNGKTGADMSRPNPVVTVVRRNAVGEFFDFLKDRMTAFVALATDMASESNDLVRHLAASTSGTT